MWTGSVRSRCFVTRQKMEEIEVYMESTMQKSTEPKIGAVIGYGFCTLFGLVCGLLVGVSVQSWFGITLLSVPLAMWVMVSVASLGCMIVWLIAEQPIGRADGYIDLPEHVVMTLFVRRIWGMIWNYNTTACLNRAPDVRHGPVAQLLLCVFVPFYQIYWYYRQGRKIDKLNAQRGVSTETGVVCLFLGIFIPVAADIFMQHQINSWQSDRLEIGGTPVCAGGVEVR